MDYNCDWKAGFILDPTKKQRVGYLTDFGGIGMNDPLAKNVTVFTPYQASNDEPTLYGGVTIEEKKATVVGVIESFSFAGGVGDPICIGAYIAAENATMLAAKMETTLTTTKITALGWWICNFDSENKVWFQEAYPKSHVTITGQLNAPGGNDVRLRVSPEATKIAQNIDVNVYHVYFEVIPAANETYDFHFAESSKTNFARNWGLKIGTNATAAMGA